jgi:hypothetical protein
MELTTRLKNYFLRNDTKCNLDIIGMIVLKWSLDKWSGKMCT